MTSKHFTPPSQRRFAAWLPSRVLHVDASPARTLAGVTLTSALLTLLGCSTTAAPALRPASAPKATSAAPEPTPARTGLEPLTDEERALSVDLERDVKKIAELTCPKPRPGKARTCARNSDAVWELAEISDWLSAQLEQAGYQVNRHGIELDGSTVMNLEVEVPGGLRGGELIVVGAHYDAVSGTPGADDNASGVAGVLALARSYAGRRHQRSLRFVLFVNEEPPHFQTPTMGSYVYAKSLSESGRAVRAMLSLESIGYYSDAPKSQQFPTATLARQHSPVGDFVAVLGDETSAPLVDVTSKLLHKHATLPVEQHVLASDVQGIDWSDHWSFWQFGYPAVMITDTAPFRNPNYHKETDTPETLDYGRMARVVSGVDAAIVDLAGGPYL
ncbi:MAG: M28 family peptidase [Myxococcales bacterium]|nr:M28 family peptidase [Myxococcales bacterium]